MKPKSEAASGGSYWADRPSGDLATVCVKSSLSDATLLLFIDFKTERSQRAGLLKINFSLH